MANVANSPKTRAASASRPAPGAPELRCSGLLSETVSNAVEVVASGVTDPEGVVVIAGDISPSACRAVAGAVDPGSAASVLLVAFGSSSTTSADATV